MECNECDKDWFELNVIPNDQHPLGFNEWCETIQHCKYTIYLPDGSTVFARLFRDHNGIYNSYEYTNYLLNRYNEIHDI